MVPPCNVFPAMILSTLHCSENTHSQGHQDVMKIIILSRVSIVIQQGWKSSSCEQTCFLIDNDDDDDDDDDEVSDNV